MAAIDTFNCFLVSLTDAERKLLEPQARSEREDLFAARSEDARLRIVQKFIADAQRLPRPVKG